MQGRAWIEKSDRLLFAVTSVVVVLSALLVLSFDHGRDQSIYHLVAREMLDGKMPYRDAFDFKPPGIFLIYSASRALFGASMRGIRIVEVACLFANAFFLIALARAYFQNARAGYLAAALASQIHAQLDFWHTAQPETFGGTMTLLVLYLLRPRGHAEAGAIAEAPSLRRYAIAGALLGFTFLLKPPLVGAAGVIAIDRLLQEGRCGTGAPLGRAVGAVRRTLPAVGALAGGAIAIVGLTLAYFGARGALGALHEVLFVFTPEYTRLSWENRTFAGMAVYGFAEWFTTYSAIQCVGILFCLGFRAVPARSGWLVFGVIAIHVLGVVMQGKFFPYHYAATFPLAALLAGAGLERALAWAGTRLGWAGRAGFVLLMFFLLRGRAQVPSFGNAFFERTALRAQLFLLGPNTQEGRDDLASVADVNAGQNRRVAEYVRASTPAGTTMFVWGFECAIYDIAERKLASRFIYNVPQRAAWSKERTENELWRELEATRPAAILVEHHDVFPMVTGNDLDSSRSLAGFRALDDLIASRYRMAAHIGDLDVYLRDDEGEGAVTPPGAAD